MSTAIVQQQSNQIQQWKSPTQIKQRIEAIQTLMQTVLKKDTDYGIIPGMPKGTKPSLWKPGSEQILAMFQIAVDPVVEDLSVEDCYRYRVTTRLTNVQTGEFLGAGIGEASTDETKYKWKACYSKAEFDATDPDRRRIKFSTWDNNTKEQMQVRQEPADLANTILKMAKKRSQIDATLTVTGASSMFEQDLEDLPEETRQEMARQRTAGKKSATSPPVGDVMCADCGKMNGHDSTCKHAKKVDETGKCSECNAQGGHLPKCSLHAAWKASLSPQGSAPVAQDKQTDSSAAQTTTPDAPNGFVRLAVKIEGLTVNQKKPLRRLSVVSDDGTKMISCFHDSLIPILDEYLVDCPAMAVLEVSKAEKDGKTYTNLQHILEIDGVPFVNDRPAETGEGL